MPRGVKGSGSPAWKAAQSVQPAAEQPRPAAPASVADHRKPPASVDIASLAGEHLREYARRIGVSRRDCDSLTEDRLRQNCRAFLAQHFELLTED